MIAAERVPVACPVDAEGRVTGDLDRMAGLAGRGGPDRTHWEEGEDFPLITDKECLAVLAVPMDLYVGGLTHRLPARENIYVTVERGRIVDFAARHRKH